MAVTIYDIARELGTTHATVSRALRQDPAIAVNTRERVMKQAAKMGYRVNLLARGLTKGKTNTIGVLVGAFQLEIASAKVVSLDELATAAGYRLYLTYTRNEFERTVEAARELVARGVDGLIIFGSYPWIDDLRQKQELDFGVPTVFLDRPMPFPARQVVLNRSAGVERAVEALYNHGHREIFFLGLSFPGWLTDARTLGFKIACEDVRIPNIKDRLIEICPEAKVDQEGFLNYDLAEIARRLRQFISQRRECTAIVCNDDYIALTVLSNLVSMGVRVPQDISVVGFNNILASRYSSPPLSTVAQPIRALSKAASDMLLEGITNRDMEPKTVEIVSEYVARESTGPVRKEKLLRAVD